MPVSQKEIARAVGLGQSTVSMALAGHPEIREETRRLVQEVARRLGYRPDPHLSGLAAYRKAVRPASFQATLGFITTHRTRDEWRSLPFVWRPYEGALRRAERLGYKLEDFWLGEKGMTPGRLRQILLTRNVTGLLFAPQSRTRARIAIDVSRFAAMSFGFTMVAPRLHGVGNNNYRTMLVLMRRLRALGYRRPGLCLRWETNERSDHAWLSAFWSEQQRLPAPSRLPWLVEKGLERRTFLRWFRRHRPDCVVSMGLSDHVYGWLKDAGMDVPGDVGFARASLDDPDDPVTGMYENFEEVGSQAADWVVGMLHRHEYGEPAVPVRALVEGTWNPGTTVRRQAGAASRRG